MMYRSVKRCDILKLLIVYNEVWVCRVVSTNKVFIPHVNFFSTVRKSDLRSSKLCHIALIVIAFESFCSSMEVFVSTFLSVVSHA